MRLFLLRHAHTEKVRKGMSDFERELDERGKKQLEGLTNHLRKNYSDVQFQICCSPAVRTKSTFKAIEPCLSIKQTSYDHELYLPSRNNLLHYLWNLNQFGNDIMIVSHNNGISDLASYILDEPISLPTCALVVIRFDDFEETSEISAGLGVLEDTYYM